MKPDRREAPLALVVDDDAVNRLLTREALEGAGWSVEEAVNGREGLAAFQRLHPDVVLMDVMMPEMDGFAACAALRSLPDGAHTPVLIMTGLDDYPSITRAYNAGATDFLTKPLNGLLLTHRVRYIVRASRVLRELRDSQASLLQARDAAIEGTRLKSEFLATVSHETRTPLNGVLGMADWLLDTELTQEQRDCAETIRTSGQTLLGIIDDLLDFSKIESGKLQLKQVDFDLRRLLADVVGLFHERARGKGVALSCLTQPPVPAWLRGDPDRLRQILSNLIGNAVKFTERGQIEVHADVEEIPSRQDPLEASKPPASGPAKRNNARLTQIRFTVSDTGIGIAPEARTRIFKPFMQADGSTTRKYDGAGLGLAICQQLVELMGGSIRVDSEPGHGSVFQFTVPLERKAD